ncbi:MAG: nitronate monooxygenase [Chloroflexi bacterium]|nr:nitronate monooxygenase [Chloroflexota bacterium]
MLTTRFTDLVGCSTPIQQAGMGALAPPELAAAVSEAGALGMIGTARPGGHRVDAVRGLLERVHDLTSRPFGVNFIISPQGRADIDPGCFEVAARSARVVEFFYGWPDRALVDIVHHHGALVCWQVGSTDEAVAAEQVGADLLVAQGIEAGGHVRGTIGVLPLLSEILEVVRVPVLAAGGVGNPRALAAVLAAGASGARIGTRFAAAEEANGHADYVERLVASSATDTVYTTAFSANWPNAPHRVLRSCVQAAETLTDNVVGETPSLDGAPVTVGRFDCLAVDSGTTGRIDAMSLWAGESVGNVKRLQPAAEIVGELAQGAEALLRRW